MAQLDLTALQLKEKGFCQHVSKKSVNYRKDTINGYFMFNPLEEIYRWYHVTVIEDSTNHVLLNIECEISLTIIIKAFALKVKKPS